MAIDEALDRIEAQLQEEGQRVVSAIHGADAVVSALSPRPGSAAGRDAKVATTFDFGFSLGPRVNAAGRLAGMTLGIARSPDPNAPTTLSAASTGTC